MEVNVAFFHIDSALAASVHRERGLGVITLHFYT